MSVLEMAVLGGGILALAWLVFGAVVAVIARRRGGGTVPWILLGALLGPVGLYLIYKVFNHQCDNCHIPVLRGVRTCPNCGEAITRLEHNPVGPMWTYRRDW